MYLYFITSETMKTTQKICSVIVCITFAIKVYLGMEWSSFISGLSLGIVLVGLLYSLTGDKNA